MHTANTKDPITLSAIIIGDVFTDDEPEDVFPALLACAQQACPGFTAQYALVSTEVENPHKSASGFVEATQSVGGEFRVNLLKKLVNSGGIVL